jgi:tetratricopeptide (TPR) repeat protein
LKKIFSAYIYLFLIVLFIVPLVLSCANNEEKFIEEFNTVMTENKGESLEAALENLDSKYPERLRTKINLAASYLDRGDEEKAALILEKGLAAAEKSKNNEEKYIFYANYSEYILQQKKYSECLDYGKKALEAGGEADPLGASLTMAQAFAAENKYSEALLYFRNSWKNNVNLFSDNDLITFVSLLGVSQNGGEDLVLMISLIDEMRSRNPSLQGSGIKQAEILEQAGAPLAALVAAFSELERSIYDGSMTREQVLQTIEFLKENIDANGAEEKSNSLKMAEGYKFFTIGQWGLAEAVFAELKPEIPIVFYSYLRLSSMLQTGLGNDEVISQYAKIERNFSGVQGYYYHFWNGMKKGSGTYDAETASNVLKNCILSAPGSPYALESRMELGNLNGIQNGKDILIIEELFYYLNSVMEGAPPEILEPAAVMLEMEDNIFISDSMLLLKEAFKNERISLWFNARAEKGNARLKERISSLNS